MTKTASLSLLLLAVLLFPSQAAGVKSKGHLVVVGGGKIPDEILARALALSGGPSASVAIFPQASELADTGQRTMETWKKAGAGRAVSVALTDLPAALRAINEATLIWFTGGDQNRLTKAMENTGVPAAILKRYREGATVGGTSAGAAVLSGVMITGDADLQGITAGATRTAAGFSLWPAVIFDQHFLKRQRHSRLISLVMDHPELVGVGIDEQTAVIVEGDRLEVAGKSSVVVVDARKAGVVRRPAGQPSAGRNIKMHILTAGMTYDLKKNY